MSGWRTPRRSIGKHGHHVHFREISESDFNVINEGHIEHTTPKDDLQAQHHCVNVTFQNDYQYVQNFQGTEDFSSFQNPSVLTMKEQVQRLAAISKNENKENITIGPASSHRQNGNCDEIHCDNMYSNEGPRNLTYLNSTESLLPATEYIKKLGAAEYEMKQVYKEVGELKSVILSQEKNEYELKLAVDTLKKEISEKSEEVKHSNEKMQQMRKYVAQLPAVDEADRLKADIQKFQNERTKLAAVNSMLHETNLSLKEKLRDKENEHVSTLKLLDDTGAKLKNVGDDFEKYKERINSITNFRNKVEIENVFVERDRCKENISHLEKILDVKQKSIEKLKVESELCKRNFEEQLAQEENTVIALKSEFVNKDQIIKDLRNNAKLLNAKKQEILNNNLELKAQYENLKTSINANENEELCRKELYEELNSCFEEFTSLVSAFTQYVKGNDPDVSLLLGTKDSSIQDSSSVLSSTKKIQEIKDLRKAVSELRRDFSDKYIRTLGENCIMQ